MRLQGVDAVVEAGERLEFRWGRSDRLSLAPEACAAVYSRPYDRNGSLRLVFRFRPTPSEVNGASHITVGIVVTPEHAGRAWEFVQVLVAVYGIADVAWTDGSKVVPEQAARIPVDGPDWLNAPASPRTEELLTWVSRRLVAETDR